MADAVFAPGVVKTGKAPITIIPAGLAMQAELWLTLNGTTKAASSGKINFNSTGVVQTVNLPITMPNVGGTYQVMLDVYYGADLILPYQNVDDVIIITGTVGPITW